jgi:hypothetical protein
VRCLINSARFEHEGEGAAEGRLRLVSFEGTIVEVAGKGVEVGVDGSKVGVALRGRLTASKFNIRTTTAVGSPPGSPPVSF